MTSLLPHRSASASRTPRRTARSIGALLTAALVLGGAAVAAAPAHADDLIAVPFAEHTIAAFSSEMDPYPAPPALDGTAAAAIDGDYTTQWVSRYTVPAPAPHWISIDLQREISVAAVDYSVKVGQRVAAKEVEIYVTGDRQVATSAPQDGGWGEAVATATLRSPSANDQKQRIELDRAVSGRYVAFVILEAQDPSGNGGGASAVQVLSDRALPPIEPEVEPEKPPVGDTATIARGGIEATVALGFPQIVSYTVDGESFAGQAGSEQKWAVNGRSYAAETTSSKSGSGIDYVSRLSGIDATIHSTIRVTAEGNVVFEVTKIEGAAAVNTLGLPDNTFLSASGSGVTLDRTVVSPDSTQNADQHLVISAQTPIGQAGAAYAFLGNGTLVGSIITNATTQGTSSSASWNARVSTRITAVDGRTAEIGSSTWLVQPTTASDPRVATYELPKVTVLFAGDRNGDGAVDWQDGAIRYRDVDTVRLGAERVAERVVTRIPFNFASSATNYFDLTLENTKRIANQTDGLGQWVLNKGYGSEGHDSANTDYGDNFNERAGGVADLNNLVDQGALLNADMSVHVNATEMYPQANAFDSAIISGAAPYKPAWNWLDQSYSIDQQADLGSGRVIDRFQQLRDAVPGLSGVYIDVYYSNGWVAEGLAGQLREMGLEIATEWGDKFVDNAVWAHWPNDLSYGGVTNKGINSTMVRFIQNGQTDVWNDDALLGQQRLVDAEGWVGNQNWDGFIDNVWSQSLPTKFIQHFDLLTYDAKKSATLTDDVEISMDGGVRVITMGGAEVLRGDAYLLPWQSLASNSETGSPTDADKMYFYSTSGGSKTFDLTAGFSGNATFEVYRLGDQGRESVGAVTASAGRLTLDGDARTAYVVVPQGGAKRAAAAYGSEHLIDPGFNAGTLEGWNPTGTVSLERSDLGTAKNQSRGDNVAVFGAEASSIGQTVTGLVPGQRYSFSAQVQISPTALREVTVAVDTGQEELIRTWNLSPTTNYMRADSKAGQTYQRASVSFLAPDSGTAEVSVAAAAGDAEVRVDNARIMTDTTSATSDGHVYSNDFEGNQPGWGPFVKGNAGNIDDPRTSISRRHDPYTSQAWRNTAAPFAPGGALAGLAVDTTLSGEHSLMSHAENSGLVYRTDPTLVDLTPGHLYRIDFDYQAGATGSYRWLTGTDTVAGGKVTSTTLSSQPIPQALQTTAFSHELAVGCGDYTWVGLARHGGPDVDFILDAFTITDLGEIPGGSACANLQGDGAVLNPGAQARYVTTFTNTESGSVENVGVQLDLPEGYEVEVAEGSSNLFAEVATGESVSTTWLITAPVEAAGTAVSLGIAATYRIDCDVRTVRVTESATVASRSRIPDARLTASASSEETQNEDGKASNMLDADPGTYWHSRWSTSATSYPHVVTLDLGATVQVDGITYLRRTANQNGPIKDYEIAVSTNGEDYETVASGAWANIAEWQDSFFAPVEARYVRLTATSSISGTQFAAIAGIGVYGAAASEAGTAPQPRPVDDLTECEVVIDPTLALTADSVRAGETIGARLTGFAPASEASFWLGDTKLSDVVLDASGALEVDLLIPAGTVPGSYDLIVKDADGTKVASARIEVQPAAPVVNPTVTPSVSTVAAGQTVDLELRGFESNASTHVWLHSTPVKLDEVAVSEAGHAIRTVTIPASAEVGAHAIVVTTPEGAELARADLLVTEATGGSGSGGDGTLALTGGTVAGGVLVALLLLVLGMALRARRLRLPDEPRD